MDIILDFDGTVVEHEYPKIGRCNFGCFEVIKKLQDANHRIILNTYRADENNGTLEKALKMMSEDSWMFLKDRNGDNEIKPILYWKSFKINPAPWPSIEEMKTCEELFIDDIATGIPLKPACMTNSKMVDWDIVEQHLKEAGIIS